MIEPGAELDRLVAESCGLTVTDVDPSMEVWIDNDNGTISQCNPSVNLNAAFAAAEACELFGGEDSDCILVLQKDYHGQTGLHDWIVHNPNASWEEGNLGQGDTPALAICAAILELKDAQARD